MKSKLSIFVASALIFLACATKASAGLYNFAPANPDIFDLDHYKYDTWGIRWTPNPNEVIVSARLTIENINNWTAEDNDRLFIHLLDRAPKGLKTYEDNQGGGDNFASWPIANILLDTYTDLYDSPGPVKITTITSHQANW